jgi:DNA-binding MarR family transcriptional regulator
VRTRPSGRGPAYPEGSAWDRPGFVLWHATLRWQREVAAALRPLGLTHVQFVLLAGTHWLETRDRRGPSQRELAEHAGTDAMMTSQVIRALEARGLVRREPDARDARVRRLRTTPPGRRLARRAVHEVERLDERIFDALPANAPLVELLRVVAGRDASGSPLP